MKKYLSIDIGGTLIKYAIMDEEYHIYQEQEEPTLKGPSLFFGQLLSIIRGAIKEINGIAICLAGFINPETGVNSDFSVGENFRKYNLKETLSRLFGLPVLIENDSNCAALGELVAGAAKGCDNICMITLGTGIGGAFIQNGQLYRGSHFKAGEAGQTYVGIRAADRGIACESAGATAALVREVSNMLGQNVDGIYIFNHISDPLINKIYQDWLLKVAITVGNMAVLFDPEKLLIGGGISKQEGFIRDLRRKVYDLYPHLEEYTDISACGLGNNAGKVGALHLLLRERSLPSIVNGE